MEAKPLRRAKREYRRRQVVQTAQEMCYRSMHNVVRRGAHERTRHARLFAKQRRVRSLVHGMRLRGEPQHHIDDVGTPKLFSFLRPVIFV